MQSTDSIANMSANGSPRGDAMTRSAHARVETLFAGDDTSAVDAFHASTTWGRGLDRALAQRLRAFLQEPVLRELVNRSRNEYPHAESFVLPEIGLGDIRLEDALMRRRSLASDANPEERPISLDDLSAILKYSYGVVGQYGGKGGGPVRRLRPCPSAGALYPLEIYPVVMAVEGLVPGVYHYDPLAHGLSLLRSENPCELMPGFDMQPGFKLQASVVFIVTAVMLRSTAKYRERGYRFIMNEAGALAQNLHLTAQARGLSGCIWGGFCDGDVASYVGADATGEIVVLGFVLGKHQEAKDEAA